MSINNCDIVQEELVTMAQEAAQGTSKTSMASGKMRGKQTAKSQKQSLDTSVNSVCADRQATEEEPGQHQSEVSPKTS
jgi:hypothetical protein